MSAPPRDNNFTNLVVSNRIVANEIVVKRLHSQIENITVTPSIHWTVLNSNCQVQGNLVSLSCIIKSLNGVSPISFPPSVIGSIPSSAAPNVKTTVLTVSNEVSNSCPISVTVDPDGSILASNVTPFPCDPPFEIPLSMVYVK